MNLFLWPKVKRSRTWKKPSKKALSFIQWIICLSLPKLWLWDLECGRKTASKPKASRFWDLPRITFSLLFPFWQSKLTCFQYNQIIFFWVKPSSLFSARDLFKRIFLLLTQTYCCLVTPNGRKTLTKSFRKQKQVCHLKISHDSKF
jgi:hypothetical protein